MGVCWEMLPSRSLSRSPWLEGAEDVCCDMGGSSISRNVLACGRHLSSSSPCSALLVSNILSLWLSRSRATRLSKAVKVCDIYFPSGVVVGCAVPEKHRIFATLLSNTLACSFSLLLSRAFFVSHSIFTSIRTTTSQWICREQCTT